MKVAGYMGLIWLLFVSALSAKRIAYIYGDVADDGTIPSGAAPAFHQMLLSDTGSRGCSEFRAMVVAEGYQIDQFYDRATILSADFLNQFDAIVFGLHQEIWTTSEKEALDDWIRKGGGILMYSDSASGGSFREVGIKNTTGQMAVNNILTAYGMQVTVDQGGGTRAYASEGDACHPVVWDQPEFEGEGVSPVAVDESSGAEVLIPFENEYRISGSNLTIDSRNISIPISRWAALASNEVGDGTVMAIFDRQPVWNNGEGSSIRRRDNREVLRRIVKYLVRDYGNSPEWFRVRTEWKGNPSDGLNYLELRYRQWSGGTGVPGVDYVGHRTRFVVEYSPDLRSGPWVFGAEIAEQVNPALDLGDETEVVTIRVLPANSSQPRGFARLRTTCVGGESVLLGKSR